MKLLKSVNFSINFNRIGVKISMKIKTISLILFFFLFPLISFGQTTENIDPAIDNLSVEYAECAAFFSIAYQAAEKKDGEEDLAKRLGDLQIISIRMSLVLASKGRDLKMANKVTRSRIAMFNQDMKDEMGNNLANFSILMSKYLKSCVRKTSIAEEWLKKKDRGELQ